MGSNMVQEEKERVTRLIELMEPKPGVVVLLMNHKDRAIISQLEVLGTDKVEMGEMNDRKKSRDTGVSFENDSHEESDTEDSYELEIIPQ